MQIHVSVEQLKAIYVCPQTDCSVGNCIGLSETPSRFFQQSHFFLPAERLFLPSLPSCEAPYIIVVFETRPNLRVRSYAYPSLGSVIFRQPATNTQLVGLGLPKMK